MSVNYAPLSHVCQLFLTLLSTVLFILPTAIFQPTSHCKSWVTGCQAIKRRFVGTAKGSSQTRNILDSKILDRKRTRLNFSYILLSYIVFFYIIKPTCTL